MIFMGKFKNEYLKLIQRLFAFSVDKHAMNSSSLLLNCKSAIALLQILNIILLAIRLISAENVQNQGFNDIA